MGNATGEPPYEIHFFPLELYSKMLAELVALAISPLGTALGLMLLGAVFYRLYRRLAVCCLALACIWLMLWSMPAASEALRSAIEASAGPRVLEAVYPAEVGVVLGGGLRGSRLPQRPYPDLNASADRIWHAARLYHAGKVRKLVLSGGVVRSGDESEAQAMRVLLNDLGVPDSALLLEGSSANTRANAQETRAVLETLGVREVVLITSALHMPRARRAFESRGITVFPAPTDFEVVPVPMGFQRLLPDAYALAASGRAFKEVAGLWWPGG